MPIRGLRDTAPYHWDGIPGDPYGGSNTANITGNELPNCDPALPESCTRFLVDAGLATTMCLAASCPANDEGKNGALTAAERDAMATFLLSVPYPPAQRRAYDNVVSDRAVDGFELFHVEGDLQGDPDPNVCGDCHRFPFLVTTNTPGTGMDAPTWRGAYDRWLILPQGRLNIIDFSFYSPITILGTPERQMWRLSWARRQRFDPVWDMVVEGSTGFSGSFARQLTLNADTAGLVETTDLFDALEQAASEGGVVLHADGVLIDAGVATPVALQFDAPFEGGTYAERSSDPETFSREELLTMAMAGEFVGTFTARIGEHSEFDSPQPAIWTRSPLHLQSGRQIFPDLAAADTTMRINGRHIRSDATIYVDGRVVSGLVSCTETTPPNCSSEALNVQLNSLPAPSGIHLLQLQNPDGLFTNDFIFTTQ